MSVIDLENIDLLEKNVDDVANLLMKGLSNQKNNSVKKMIKVSRNRLVCTHFDEPSYIDLHHFYGNLLANINHIELLDGSERQFKRELAEFLGEGRELIEEIILCHTEGESLCMAHGISIYFPERRIHSSYGKTIFAQENQWMDFLINYLSS